MMGLHGVLDYLFFQLMQNHIPYNRQFGLKPAVWVACNPPAKAGGY